MGDPISIIAIGATVASTAVGVSQARQQGRQQEQQARLNAEAARMSAKRNRQIAENNKLIAEANAQRVEAEAAFRRTVIKRRARTKEEAVRKRFRQVEATARTRGRSQEVLTSLYLDKEAEANLIHMDLLDELGALDFEAANQVQDILFSSELQAEELEHAATLQDFTGDAEISNIPTIKSNAKLNAFGTLLSGVSKGASQFSSQSRISSLEESLAT